jgi:thioredoxin-related protein
VKIAFLIAAIVIAGGIVIQQKYLPVPKGGWIDNDLDKAFQIARNENRNLLVLFVNKTPSQTDRNLRDTTLSKPKNIEAIQEHNLVAVMVRVSPSQRREVFETYALKNLPTMLILSPAGEELARAEGKVGEVAFAQSFLPSAQAPSTP